jgi:acyl carrier protein
MDVLYEVKQIIAKQARVPIDQLTVDTRLETLGIESIDVIEIVFALEEKFGVTLPFNANESAVSEFETIGKVAEAVKSVVVAKAAS